MNGIRASVIAASTAVAAVSLVLVFSVSGCKNQPVDPQASVQRVSVVKAQKQPITRTLDLAGVFQAYQEIDVHAKVSGYVRHIYVDIGDRVRKGQTLAVLEVPELDAQVEGAQSSVERSTDEIARLKRELARDEALYSAAHLNYVRLKQASDQKPGLIAQQELDDALARDQSTGAQVDAARSAISAAEGQLGMAKAEKLRTGSLQKYSIITAPFDGVVTARYADTGSLIPAGTAESNSQALVRLAQSDLLRLRMAIPEADVPFVHEGSTVTVRIQANGREFAGTVVRFSRDVSTETRTMETEVDIPNPELALTPGMYADVHFELQKKDDALTVPTTAVIQGDNPSVMVVNSAGEIEKRVVKLGITGANLQEIVDGLAAGETVVAAGQSSLHEGERVTPVAAKGDLLEYHDAGTQGGR